MIPYSLKLSNGQFEKLPKAFPRRGGPALGVVTLLNAGARNGTLAHVRRHHKCLGVLEGRDRSEQVKAFMDEEHADRQLLVALHVLTKGLPFEQIVLNE